MIHFPIPIFQRNPHGYWYYVAKDAAAGLVGLLGILCLVYVILA